MSRAFLTAVVTTLALGSFTPRLAAQDTTSATGRARPDTSGYTGVGGVDTTQRPGRVGVADTTVGGVTDTNRIKGDSIRGDSSRARQPSDSSGMNGRRAADSAKTQATQPTSGATSPQPGMSSDSAGAAQPTSKPGQSTSASGP